MRLAAGCSDVRLNGNSPDPLARGEWPGSVLLERIGWSALSDADTMPIWLVMPRGVRDILLVVCALICAAAAIYIVYNIEVFKHRYDLQFLGQPDQQQ